MQNTRHAPRPGGMVVGGEGEEGWASRLVFTFFFGGGLKGCLPRGGHQPWWRTSKGLTPGKDLTSPLTERTLISVGGSPPWRTRPGAHRVPPSRAPPCPPVPGPPVSPRPGAPSVPPSRADPGPPAGRTIKVTNVFRFKIDAKSIPEALATTILILQKFSIDLAHRQNHGASAHPAPSDAPHPHLIGTSRHP